MPAWLSSGTRQRTKRLSKSASEGDTRIDDRSGGSPLTIETGSDFPIGIIDHGYVRLIDSIGTDLNIVRDVRVRYDAAWRAGEDQGSDARLIRRLWKNHYPRPFETVSFTSRPGLPFSSSASGTGTGSGATTSYPPAIWNCPKSSLYLTLTSSASSPPTTSRGARYCPMSN
jgi:hypothetical protein